MKTVQDKDGNIIEVADDTPCHAGKNGALPIMLDKTLDAGIFSAMEVRDAAALVESPRRIALSEIKRLESQQTNRRMREHALGIDNGWLAAQDALIAAEREKL